MTATDVYPAWRCSKTAPASNIRETQTASDYALAQRAAEGDMAAFAEMYERHNRGVSSLCLRMTGNTAEAENLTQVVFVQVFREAGDFCSESDFTTWLHRLTVGQVLMHFRKRGMRMEQTTDDGETPRQVVTSTTDLSRMPIIDRLAIDRAIAN